jgi:hypothetical protein
MAMRGNAVQEEAKVLDCAAAHHIPDMEEKGFLAHMGGLTAYSWHEREEFDLPTALADRILTCRWSCRPASISP